MISQQPPNNPELEQYILGCLILDRQDSIYKLREDDFYNNTNVLIFKVIKFLSDKGKQIDLISVSDILGKKLDDALTIVSGVLDKVATTANFDSHLDDLKVYSMKRAILKKSYELQELAFTSEHGTAIDLKNDALQKLSDIETLQTKKKLGDIQSIVLDALNDIEERYNAKDEEKMFTGFYDLDRLIAGLHKEEITILAARPGVGKTAFALQLMIQLAKKGNHSLLISREMSTMQLAKRLLSNIGKIDGNKLRLCKTLTDDDWQKIGIAQGILTDLPIEINDTISTVQEIRAYCRELKGKGKLDLLIIDYLGLLKSIKKAESKRIEIEDISRQLKEMSMEFNIPVVVLCQMSREAVKEGEPQLHHLRESGAIEQDADNVLFLHVPKDTDESKDTFDIKVIVAKQRNGSTGHIYLSYVRKMFTFYNKSSR